MMDEKELNAIIINNDKVQSDAKDNCIHYSSTHDACIHCTKCANDKVKLCLSLIQSSSHNIYQLRIDYTHKNINAHHYYPTYPLNGDMSPMESLHRIKYILSNITQIIDITTNLLRAHYLAQLTHESIKTEINTIEDLLKQSKLQNIEFEFNYDLNEGWKE